MTASPRLLNTSTRHGRAILRRLPVGDIHGVEVGVCRGVLSQFLLSSHAGLWLTMVDHWQALSQDSEAYRWSLANDEPCNVQTPAQVEDNYRTTLKVAERFAGRCAVNRGPSVQVAEQVRDGCFDFVFLDADHAYESAAADIAAWLPKVKPGGWIGGHDYGTPKFGDGVVQAVDEFIAGSGLTLETDEFYTWFAEVKHDA